VSPAREPTGARTRVDNGSGLVVGRNNDAATLDSISWLIAFRTSLDYCYPTAEFARTSLSTC
jgi:hypothetical protein